MTVIIIQARMSSTRLPGKVMKDLCGKPLLWHVISRCLESRKANMVCVATSLNKEDDVIADFCGEEHFSVFRGSLEDVLSRYYEAAKTFKADTIVRVTADCPLTDAHIIDSCVEAFETSGADYVSNVNPARTFPRGLDVEVFSFSSLAKAHQEATTAYEREHVTPYLWENRKGTFNIGPSVVADTAYRKPYRLAVDFPEDFELMQRVYQALYVPGKTIDVLKALTFLDEHKEVRGGNAHREP